MSHVIYVWSAGRWIASEFRMDKEVWRREDQPILQGNKIYKKRTLECIKRLKSLQIRLLAHTSEGFNTAEVVTVGV